jgi:exosortase/archaeosortase family protein
MSVPGSLQNSCKVFLKSSALMLIGFVIIKHQSFEGVLNKLCSSLAKFCYYILSWFDSNVHINGRIIFWKTYGYAVEIDYSCSAILTMVTVSAGILSLQANVAFRLKCCLMAIILVQLINLLRIILVFYANVLFDTQTFNVIHEQFLNLSFVFCVTIIFIHIFKKSYNTGLKTTIE